MAQEPVGITLAVGSYSFCAVSIAAPGVEGGDPIDITTLCNTEWFTKQAPTLKDVPNFSLTVLYDATEYEDIIALVNVNSTCVFTITDVGAITFYGYVKNFIPGETGKGEAMTATVEIVVTNNNGGVETGPAFA